MQLALLFFYGGKKMDDERKFLLMILGTIIIALGIGFIFFESTNSKLDEACNEYGMIYEYRNGKNCLDKDNVLRPIVSDCSIFRWKECDIRFINLEVTENARSI